MRDPFFDMGPSALDVFDPFNAMDRLTGQNIRWLSEPDFLPPRLMQPLVPQKYRITLDCSGFSESSIKTNVRGNQLEISAMEGTPEDRSTGNYSLRELKKTYDLPDYVDTSRLVSFMTSDGTLVVEFPWKEDRLGTTSLLPRIDLDNKKVTLDVDIPENIDPAKLHVTCRDHDLIIRADYRVKNEDGSTRSRVHYLRRTTLPENTKFDTLKCETDEKKLSISADLGPHHRTRIPIQHVGVQSIQQAEQPMQA
jgi:HSP20 family molecular chaperone IbpA